MQYSDVFEHYKPLRNLLRKVCLVDSLGVVRGYVQHLQFNRPLPNDVEVDKVFGLASDKVGKLRFISEWELETLCRETIINAEEMDSCPETFRRWSYLARTINRIKDIEGLIARKYIDHDNILAGAVVK
jgi:hypothetical protein